MLILLCAKYYVLETKNIGDMTKFSELPEQPSYLKGPNNYDRIILDSGHVRFHLSVSISIH